MLKIKLPKIPFQLLIRAAILTFLISAYFPSNAFANAVQYSVRFTASYVSGNTGSKSVYYILDGGSSQLLGTVSNTTSLDVTFNATFSTSARVYVSISDDAIYNEALYINSNLVASGSVGNGGLTYTRNDSTPPSGRITYPISGMTITKCPIMVTANVSDDISGVAWVIYLVKYDGVWHQIGTDDSASGADGWGTPWNCSQVADQELDFRISARDNAGNQGNILGGDVLVALSRSQPTSTMTLVPSQTSLPPVKTTAVIPIPTQTLVVNTSTLQPAPTAMPPTATLTAVPTQTPEQPTNTSLPLPAPSPVPKSSPKIPPIPILLCSSILIPLVLGLGLL